MRILNEGGTRVSIRTEVGVNNVAVVEVVNPITLFKTIRLKVFHNG